MCICFFYDNGKVSGLCDRTQPMCMCMCCTNLFKKWKLHASIPNLHNHSNFNCWDLRTLPSRLPNFFFSPWLCFYSGRYRLKCCWCKQSYKRWCTISYESWDSPGKRPSCCTFLPLTSSVVIRCWLNHEDFVCFRTCFMILKKVIFFIFQECWHQLKYVSHDMCKLLSYSVKVVLSYAIFVFFDIFCFWYSQVLSACSAGAKVVKVS